MNLKLTAKIFIIFFVTLQVLIQTSCTKTIYDVIYPTLSDGRYDSEFPYRNASQQLEEIANSVKMLNYIVYYKVYYFDENQNISISELNSKKTIEKAKDVVYFNETVSGTATIIFYDGIKVGLLTCAHIGSYPDTLYNYFESSSEKSQRIVKNMAIKVRDQYFVNEIPGDIDFEVIVTDKKRDLAILSKRANNDPFQRIKSFKYPIGESSNLELGSFVYIIGYPMGHKMITRGIVSNRRDNESDSFLIDALFNRGFSGGIILAIRDGVPNFELVGMAKSVSAKNQYFLTPAPMSEQSDYEANIPYTGDIHVKKFEDINYGITYTISTDEIVDFLNENEIQLLQKGFNLKYLTK